MFTNEVAAAGSLAKEKMSFFRRNPFGFFVASMLAGVYVGFGVLVSSAVGGLLFGQPYAKVAMAASFGIALSLVLMAGAELFTGSNLIVTLGLLLKTVTPGEALRLWVVCYIANWLGAALLAAAFFGAGFATGPVGGLIAASAAAKMNMPFIQLLLRGILCNILVCLAVWCSIRCKSESAKLIMTFWCLFAFVVTGFEHSIANMTLLTVALFAPLGEAVGMTGYIYSILTATLGNMAGGIVFVALPYYFASKKGR